MESLISTGLAQLDLPAFPADAAAKLAKYGNLLMEQNQVMNLTAITQPFDVATLHMLDCAPLLNCGRLEHAKLIDVGTGAGFPGMVLKTLCPTLSLTLLDGLQKRLSWLETVAEQLGLEEVTTLHARAEEAGQDPGLREQFDFATARAVADLGLLCEMCLPFVKVGGRFLAMKGPECQEELDRAARAIPTLGGVLKGCYDYRIPHTDITHRVVVVEKVAPCPAKYPRRWAKMQKTPL